MSTRLEGKVALVTGGASGLGQAICERFAQAGARVAIVDLQAPGDWADQPCFLPITADISEPKELEEAFQATLVWAGQLDILVSNAAVQPHGISLEDTSPALLDKVFKVNTHSVFHGLQLARKHLTEGGSVIHTSSFTGALGVPNCPSYAASKAAVDHLTRVGAIELADRGITVNCVAPGLILTPAVTKIPDNPEIPFMAERTPMGRAANPEEVVPTYEFLASEDARFITGAIIPVDGGVSAGWAQYDLTPPPEWQDEKWNG